MGDILQYHNRERNITENIEFSQGTLKVWNETSIIEILLLGFPSLNHIKILNFSLFLLIYCLTICGNLLIIILVSHSNNLHCPMYIFLSQLSICDLLLTTNIVPNMLYIVLNEGGLISLWGCITQYLLYCSSECSECLLLTVMSYDRYLAICNPLRYNAIMNSIFCFKLIIMCWLISFSVLLNEAIAISKLWFCGPHVINHFFCDISPLLELSCSDTYIAELEPKLLSIPLVIIPFLIILISYAYIVFTILKIPSITGQRKTFSTCSSHLIVVCLFYGALSSIYSLPTETKTPSIIKCLSLLYTVVTPLINPIIYSFRNKDINEAFEKLMDYRKAGLFCNRICR